MPACLFVAEVFRDDLRVVPAIPSNWVGLGAIAAGAVMCVVALVRRKRAALGARKRH